MSTEDNPIGNPSKAKIANKVPTNEEILKLIQQLNAFFTSSTGKCPKFLQSSWEELRDYVNKNETPRRASAQVLEQTQKLLEVFSNDNSTQTEKLGALEAYKEALLRNKTNRRLWKASKILLRIGIGILILASAALLLTTVATLVLASGPVLPALLALTLGLAAKFSVLASIIMLATGLPLIAALILKINDTFAIIPGALANASEKVAKAAIAHIQDLSVKVDPTNIDEQEVAPKLLQIFFAAQATSETPILKLKKGQIYGKPGHQFKLTHAVMIVPPKGVGDQWRYLVIANDAKTKNKNNPSETSAKQFYKKRRILGKGAFGKVYQVAGEISLENEAATYKEFKKGRKLAIKKQAFANEEELEDIVREDGILAQLPRLGFIGSWDIKTKKNRKNRWEERYHTQHYGASNKLSGRTLEDVLKLNLDTDQIIALALLLLEQLPKQVHKNRIIHHDIKPENVMVKLEKDGAPREALYFDMGLARFKGEKHVPGGTPNYVAPEIALSLNQEEKTAEATATADLFAVKLMILQLFKAKLLPFLKHKDKSVNFEDRARGSCPINNSTLFENINDLTDSHKKIIIDSFLNEVMYNPSLPRWEKNIKPVTELIAQLKKIQLERARVVVDPTAIEENETNKKLLQTFLEEQAQSKTPILKLKKGQAYGKPGQQFHLTHAILLVPLTENKYRYIVIANENKDQTPLSQNAKPDHEKRKILGSGSSKKVYQVAGEIFINTGAEKFYHSFSGKDNELALQKRKIPNNDSEIIASIKREDEISQSLPILGFQQAWDIPKDEDVTIHYGLTKKISGRTLKCVIEDIQTGKLRITTDQTIALARLLIEQIPLQVHDNGIIHRDIKPDNVMVDFDNEGAPLAVTYIDFGSAQKKDELLIFEANPFYVSPEVAALLYAPKFPPVIAPDSTDKCAVGLIVGELFGALFKDLSHEEVLVERMAKAWPFQENTLFQKISDLSQKQKDLIEKELKEMLNYGVDKENPSDLTKLNKVLIEIQQERAGLITLKDTAELPKKKSAHTAVSFFTAGTGTTDVTMTLSPEISKRNAFSPS